MEGPDATRDVIGVEAPERRSGLPVLVGVSVLSIMIGFGLGALMSDFRASNHGRDDGVEGQRGRDDPLVHADGGLVYVCDGHARAFLFAHDLPPAQVEVHLPLRGDDALLPVLTDEAEILTGSPDGHQYFVPQDGHLAVVQQMAVPNGARVSARVGDRRLILAVRDCGGGER